MEIGITTLVTDRGIGPAELARAVQERGFDSLFVAEHTHIPVRQRTPHPLTGEIPEHYRRALDPFVALAAAAAVTDRLLLGTAVALLVQRDPITTAKEVASLDLVSGGRVLLGIGAGWNREEMRNHGTDPATRGALLDERVRAMVAIWTQDQAEFHGEHVDFDPIYSWPKPVRAPHPPIYVGGEGPAAFRRLAEYGAGWLPTGVRDAASLAPRVAAMRAAAGADVPFTVHAARPDESTLTGLAELGAERALLVVPSESAEAVIPRLDQLAQLQAAVR